MKNRLFLSCPTAARQRESLHAMRRIPYFGPRADLPWSTSTMAEAPVTAGPIASGSMDNGALLMWTIAPTRLYTSPKEGWSIGTVLRSRADSAGGFTTLAVLAFRDVFKVGADYFGVSDLEGLAVHTHKFEERYLDILVGPYPEDKAIYRERSPLYSVDKIKCPVIILQGDEDAIVPPAQSEMMYKSLKERGIPTAYLLFKGEQHRVPQSGEYSAGARSSALFLL